MSGQGQGPGQGRGTGQTYQTQQQLTLPAGYRMTEFWGFHRRDAQRLSECDLQDGGTIRMHKGLMWKGLPTLLTLELTPQCEEAAVVQARWRLPAGAGAITGMDDVLAAMLRRMFGLSQDVGSSSAALAAMSGWDRCWRASGACMCPRPARPGRR